MKKKLTHCPNCGLIFNDYEYALQECENCNWPHCDIEDKEDYNNPDWWSGFVTINEPQMWHKGI